jgi:hypothetical protein
VADAEMDDIDLDDVDVAEQLAIEEELLLRVVIGFRLNAAGSIMSTTGCDPYTRARCARSAGTSVHESDEKVDSAHP